MAKSALAKASLEVDKALLRRIAELSRDTTPEVFPEPTAEDDFMLAQRRQAESQFQYALRNRTWMRLSPAERTSIRERLAEGDEFYRDRMGTSGFELACQDEVGRLIEEARYPRRASL